MTLPQIHFYSSSFSSTFPRFTSFSPQSASFSGSLLLYFSLRWSSPLFFCAWQIFSSSRSLRTTRSRLKELKKARSVRDWIWSGLMARIWKVCYRCWITLLFSGISAILEWEALIVSRNSSSSYIVFMVFFMLSKSSLQLGFVFINLITSSRCCTGTAKPNFNNAKCSIFTAPLMIQLQPKSTQNHIHIISIHQVIIPKISKEKQKFIFSIHFGGILMKVDIKKDSLLCGVLRGCLQLYKS